MKVRRILISLLLMVMFSATMSTAQGERYYEELDCGVIFDFEIDEKLLQPLDIFDVPRGYCEDDLSDEARAAAEAFLQKGIDLIYPDEGLEIHEYTDSYWGFVYLIASNDTSDSGRRGSFSMTELYLYDSSRLSQYINLPETLKTDIERTAIESDLENGCYPAAAEDYQFDHDFMTLEEADEQTRSLLRQTSPEDSPFEPVLREWISFTHDQLSDLHDWKIEHNDYYYTENIADYFAGEEWTKDYDGYYLEYSYTYKGYPVCDWKQTMYSGSVDSPINPKGLNTSCQIDRTGYVCFENPACFTCDYTPYEDTPALTLDEALDVVREYLGGINWLNPLTITRVYVEYLPHSTEGKTETTYEPIWNFVSDMMTKYGILENYQVYRVNGHTGEIMTNGQGIIEE